MKALVVVIMGGIGNMLGSLAAGLMLAELLDSGALPGARLAVRPAARGNRVLCRERQRRRGPGSPRRPRSPDRGCPARSRGADSGRQLLDDVERGEQHVDADEDEGHGEDPPVVAVDGLRGDGHAVAPGAEGSEVAPGCGPAAAMVRNGG